MPAKKPKPTEKKGKLAVIKTQQTSASVEDFINAVPDEQKRKDSFVILEMMKKASKEEPKMWGSSIIGFGNKRYDELAAKGVKITFEEVRENLISRDHEDTHRKENPLVQAPDAIVLDNTDLSREEQLDFVMKLVEDLKIPS